MDNQRGLLLIVAVLLGGFLLPGPLRADTLPPFVTKDLSILKRTPGRRGNPYLKDLTLSLKEADSSIIVYQYLVLGQDYDDSVRSILNTLKRKALEGVQVQIFLSESRKDPVGEPLNAAVQDFFGTAPVSVKLLSDETSLHSKVVFVDSHTAFVGSQNWTPAGLRKNIETAVKIRNRSFVSYLKERLRNSLRERWPEEFGRKEGETEGSAGEETLQPDSLELEEVTQKQLERIPGIGPTYARRIIRYRKQNRFVGVENLKGVSGIGESRLKTLQKYFK